MVELFFLLVVGHFIADYPLQGEFLAKAKNHRDPIPGVPWYQALAAHSFIHSGVVYLLTGLMWAAILELVVHALVDYRKCDGKISFNEDQTAHIVTKAIIVLIIICTGDMYALPS